jgi:asparagine synthase (glutamine-hydrolysing)
VFPRDEVQRLVSGPVEQPEQRLISALGQLGREEHAVDLALRLDLQVYMQCQLLRDSDATSMSSSLELRVPFVDKQIVALGRACPPEYKVDPHASPPAKRVLIKALDDLLPAELLSRPKRGFGLPYEQWLSGPLRELSLSIGPLQALRQRGWIGEGLPTPAIDRFPAHWSLLVLELWARAVLDAAPTPRHHRVAPALASV